MSTNRNVLCCCCAADQVNPKGPRPNPGIWALLYGSKGYLRDSRATASPMILFYTSLCPRFLFKKVLNCLSQLVCRRTLKNNKYQIMFINTKNKEKLLGPVCWYTSALTTKIDCIFH